MRAQMTVFLLKAEHGSECNPPTCTGIFPDVLCPPTYANLNRGNFQREPHRRLWQWELLPRQPGQSRADGRLSRQDVRPSAVRTVEAEIPMRSGLPGCIDSRRPRSGSSRLRHPLYASHLTTSIRSENASASLGP